MGGAEQGLRRDRKQKKANGDRSVGNRIRHLRDDVLGLTQEDFATRLGVSRGAVGNWETGQGIKRENLMHIVETFDMSFDWLARGIGQPRQIKPFETRVLELLPLEGAADDFMAMVEAMLQERAKQITRKKKT